MFWTASWHLREVCCVPLPKLPILFEADQVSESVLKGTGYVNTSAVFFSPFFILTRQFSFALPRIVLFSKDWRWPAAFVERANSFSIVILHESPNFSFHLFNRHFLCFQLIDFFFLQRGENAFSSTVVITTSDSAHALNQAVLSQSRSKLLACVLTSRVAVENRAWSGLFVTKSVIKSWNAEGNRSRLSFLTSVPYRRYSNHKQFVLYLP